MLCQHNLTLTFLKFEKLFVNICCRHSIAKMLIPAIKEKKNGNFLAQCEYWITNLKT